MNIFLKWARNREIFRPRIRQKVLGQLKRRNKIQWDPMPYSVWQLNIAGMKAFSDSRRQDEERARPFFLTDLQTTAPEEEKLAGNLSKKKKKKVSRKIAENRKKMRKLSRVRYLSISRSSWIRQGLFEPLIVYYTTSLNALNSSRRFLTICIWSCNISAGNAITPLQMPQ